MTAAASVTPAPAFARLEQLALRDFRNFARADVVLPAAGVVLVGDNGHGKTNLLEAVAYLGTLRSSRNARDRDLVRHGAPAAHIRAAVTTDTEREITIGIDRTSGKKRITIDGVDVPRQTDALGTLPSVAWAPSDVALVAGAPGERRRYVDVMLALTSRRYLQALRAYRASLERRNAALRDAARRGTDPASVAAWEPALAQHGATLVAERAAWIREHAAEFARLCAAIGERASASIAYACDVADAGDVARAIAERLAHDRARDVQRGVTSTGPHRDDLVIAMDERDVRTFGSAGQQRTAAIALRLLEARTLRAASHRHPVLLLDDPFAELDADRSARALALLESEAYGQVLLAVPREHEIPAHFRVLERWRVRDGEVQT